MRTKYSITNPWDYEAREIVEGMDELVERALNCTDSHGELERVNERVYMLGNMLGRFMEVMLKDHDPEVIERIIGSGAVRNLKRES